MFLQVFERISFITVIAKGSFYEHVVSFGVWNNRELPPVEYKGIKSRNNIFALSCADETSVCVYSQWFLDNPSIKISFDAPEVSERKGLGNEVGDRTTRIGNYVTSISNNPIGQTKIYLPNGPFNQAYPIITQ